jgi:hypothetical protein
MKWKESMWHELDRRLTAAQRNFNFFPRVAI